MASIKQTDTGAWRARVRPHPGAREVTRHFRTKGQAQTWAAQLVADASRGEMLDHTARKITLRQYGEDWRAKQPHATGTAKAVEGRLRRDIYPMLGDKPLTAIRTSDVQAAVKAWSKSLAPSTTKVTLATLRTILRAAVRDRYISRSPAEGVRLPRAERKAMRVLSVADLDAILDELPLHHQAPVVVAFGTGLRIGEVLGLRVDDVDLLRHVVHVRQQRHPDDTIGAPKTESSTRDVPIPDRAAAALADHMARYPTPGSLVFDRKRATFSQAFAKAVEKAGLEGVKFHDLRHSYASHLLAAGVPVPTVSELLGHETPAITMTTYAHVVPGSQDVALATINRIMAAESAPSPQRVRNPS